MKTRFSIKFTASALIFMWSHLFFALEAFCGKVYIPQGTEISVKFKADLTTKSDNIPSGTEIFEVATNQKITGVEAIRQGGSVYCEIIKFKKPGFLGSGGEIEIRIDSIQTALGKNIKVDNKLLIAKGKNKKLKAFLMLPVLGYGFFIKGDHAQLGRQNDVINLKTSEFETINF